MQAPEFFEPATLPVATRAWCVRDGRKSRAESAHVGGWNHVLWTFRDPKTGKQRPSAGWRPRIILKRVAPNVTFIEFTGRRGSLYRGEFLDLSNLAHALTGRHWTLHEALCGFTGEVIGRHGEYGRITPDSIAHCRQDVQATVSLAETLLDLFDRLHPVSRRRRGGHLSETHLYSPGGLTRAYFTTAGLSPPVVPKNRLGHCTTAFFGGWAEVQLRGRVPTVHVDFRRQYQTVFLLQGLQELLVAERLEFVEDTATVKDFIKNFTPDDLLRPETYPKLNVLCWIKPNGEVLLKRAAFKETGASGSDRFVMAMGPRYSDEPVPAYLPDVLTAMLQPGGGPPEIIRAERIVPISRQSLRKTRLFGGAVFDPRKHQFFKVLVEETVRFERGEGWYADIAGPVCKLIIPGVKAAGIIACFGALMETRATDLLPDRREEVTLLSDAEPLRAPVAHPEDPGPFACPPLAGLVTAAGRLLLAAIHCEVERRGGIVAACDTDGAHIVATEKGGTVYVESRGSEFYEGGQARPVHALSYSEVDGIAALFEPLNPFDRALLPGSPLRVKGSSDGLFISAKRYALTAPAGNFLDRKESILGMLLAPCEGWIDDAWRVIGEIWDGHLPSQRPWFALPAVRRLSATSPSYAREFDGILGASPRGSPTGEYEAPRPSKRKADRVRRLRPWNSFLVATAIGQAEDRDLTSLVVAPFELDPTKWATLSWRFAENGEPVPLKHPDCAGTRWRLRTLRDFLSGYARHPIPEMLAPDGSRCGPYTRGVLRRRPVRDGERWLILKETAAWGDDPRHAFSVPEPEKIRAGRDVASADWESNIKPALAVVGPTAVARKLELVTRTAQAWAAGEHQPSDPGEVARAIVAVAHGAGLGLPTDDHLRIEEICAELPVRAAAIQNLIVIATRMLADGHGGVRALARAMARKGGADLGSTVQRWLGLARSELRPIGDLNRILSLLAKFSRAEIRKLRRRVTTGSGPLGDRQAVLAYLSLLSGAKQPVVPTPEEILAFPVVFAVVEPLVAVLSQIRFDRVGDERTVCKP
jgi:hypothetical protein